MKRKQLSIFSLLLAALFLFAGCSAAVENENGGNSAAGDAATMEDTNIVNIKTADVKKEEFTLVESSDGSYTYASADGATATLTVACTEGTNSYTVEASRVSCPSPSPRCARKNSISPSPSNANLPCFASG